MPSALRFLVPALATFLVVGCATAIEGEDTDANESAVKRSARCDAEVDPSMESFATVTADNSGVKCYDESGAYVDSIVGSMNKTESQVRVLQGKKKTFSGKSGNFVKVRGVGRKNESIDCWMSANYLCPAKTTAGEVVAGWDQAADDGKKRGESCALTSTSCCASLTDSALAACNEAFNARKAEAKAKAESEQRVADQRKAQLRGIGKDCFMAAPSATNPTWAGVAEDATACCEEKLELAAERGVCIARVQECRVESENGGFFGSRVCP